MTDTRRERDALGEVEVPSQCLWGAQTQRSLEHFRVGRHPMPVEVVHALVEVKRAAARVHGELGLLDAAKAQAIVAAADEVLAGRHAGEFPLPIWQSGSGTQSNMNVNEVLANRASELLGGERGHKQPVHPNDHVNLGQSSNDVFPTAMYVAAAEAVVRDVLPALAGLAEILAEKARAFADVVKLGRTHLQDAMPMTVGQEISGWQAQVELGLAACKLALPGLCQLALGGTAVGTGLGTRPETAAAIVAELAARKAIPFVPAPNRFAALAAHDGLVHAHGALRGVAVALMKIAADVRLLVSGPRSGLGELILPANEPGSSMMPGKVNPTQAEMVTMVVARVLGNDALVGFAGSQGQLELNVFKPVLAHAFVESAKLLADACRSFVAHALVGLEPDRERTLAFARGSLMLATALVPRIGYDRAAQVAQTAHKEGIGVAEAAEKLGVGSREQLAEWLDPRLMIGT